MPLGVPITLKEIKYVLNHCKNSATGEDLIHYHMIKNLSDINLEYIKVEPPPLKSYFPYLNTNNRKNWQKAPLEYKIEGAVFKFLKKIMRTPKSAINIKLWGNF